MMAAAGRDRIPTDGLIAHYTMDAISGSTLIDEQGTYDGTITAGTQVAGVIGLALEFDGSSGGCNVDALAQSMTSSSPFSASVFFKAYDTTGQQEILEFVLWGLQANHDGWRILLVGADLYIQFFNDSGTAQNTIVSGAVAANTDYHVSIAYDGSAFAVRLNDAEIATGTAAYSTPQGGRLGTSYNAGSETLNGYIDQLRVYDRAISADESDLLYAEGA